MIEVLEYGFMQRAFLAGLMIAFICAVLGVFLVLKRLSLIGDGLAHVAFGGVALGFLLEVNPILAAMGVCLVAAFAMYRLTYGSHLYGETAIGIMVAAGLSTGVVLISLAEGFTTDLFSFLFGSILTVTTFDLWLTFSLGIVVLISVYYYYRELVFICFDEESAQAAGINVKWLNILLNVLAAITVVISIRLVGVLLVSALIVVPTATSLILARSFKQTLMYAVAVALVSVVSGLLASFYWDLAAGGAIVLSAVLLFMFALGAKKVLLT